MNDRLSTKKPEWYGNVSFANPSLQTPMMKQFVSLKRQSEGSLLLFRMGDFYELFLQDAVIAANVLELNLTSRNKKDKEPIPMAGIPYHALEGYLPRLTNAGFKVAIAEQEGDPASGKMLERKLSRIVTPGVPWDTDGVEAKESCWIACIFGSGPIGIASLDVLTGEFQVTQIKTKTEAVAEIRRLRAKELIIEQKLAEQDELQNILEQIPHNIEDSRGFDYRHAKSALCQQFKVKTLSGFGLEGMRQGVAASGALLGYVRDITLHDVSHVKRIIRYDVASHMILDEATRKNLEIIQPLRGVDKKSTLLHLMDKTCTAMGGRLLRKWIAAPLIDISKIEQRHNSVEVLLDEELRTAIRGLLRSVYDLERLATRVAQNKINPRELLSLATSIQRLPLIFSQLEEFKEFADVIPKKIPLELAKKIESSIQEEAPIAISDGGIFKKGINKDLDKLRTLSTQVKISIAEMEEVQRKKTEINSLKIKFNRVFGYFLEVTAANKDKVPKDWIRKQTLANSERFITPELKEFEEKILTSGEKMKALEHELFIGLRNETNEVVEELQSLAKLIAKIDVIGCFAQIARMNRYCRPEVDLSLNIDIKEGRHPVVEMMDMDEAFVPNDIVMNEERRFVMLTGPNMSGKSTIMRQVAIITLMAQIGSYVPARKTKIGLCDKIFVRVGASDDLSHGRSTFMVEMSETAYILNQATERSLLMLDEIGRGTSTYDGMSIAWAVSEAVHDKLKSRCIFATHYHELTKLEEKCARIVNMHVAISEKSGKIIFLRSLQSGGIGKSYGIQCAKLAGMPRVVIGRAKELLQEMELKTRSMNGIQLALFNENKREIIVPEYLEIMEEYISMIDPDDCNPRTALNHIYELVAMMRKNK
jgi:DNA mismatch repair protein MutS